MSFFVFLRLGQWPMSDARTAKLRRLDGFRRRVPHVTGSALDAICRDIATHGMPELHSRQHQSEARNLVVRTPTPHGAIHQTITLEGVADALDVAHPLAMLWHVFAHCSAWRALMIKKHSEQPSSVERPWRLVLYTDEVTPGAVLATQPTRKSQACYYSFLELGHAALSMEDVWFCVAVIRSSIVTNALGGMAQVVGAILKLFFPEEGADLHMTGLMLHDESGQGFRLHARLTVMVREGAAHRYIWKCKGDSGTRMCMLCHIMLGGSDLSDIDPSLKSNVITEGELEFCTDDEVRDAVKRLAWWQGRENKTAFARRSQIMGFTYSPYSLLTDRALDKVVQPCTQFMHDWMHGIFSNGIFNVTANLLLESLEDAGVKTAYAMLHEYVCHWKWPSRVHSSNLAKIFDAKRREGNRKGECFRAQASEGLSVYRVVAFWLRVIVLPRGIAAAACNAFLAFAALADCVVAIARGAVSPGQLRDAVHKFLDRFVAAWGYDAMTPKCHWALHLPRELARFGTLLSCFVHERKHKLIRRYATPIANAKTFEHSVLSEITGHHIAALNARGALNFDVGLVSPRRANARTRAALLGVLELLGDHEVHIAAESRFHAFETCRKGDVVFVKSGEGISVGQASCHAAIDGAPLSVVACWELKSMQWSSRSAVWRVSVGDAQLFPTSDILAVAVWMAMGDDLARTLLPPSYMMEH